MQNQTLADYARVAFNRGRNKSRNEFARIAALFEGARYGDEFFFSDASCAVWSGGGVSIHNT